MVSQNSQADAERASRSTFTLELRAPEKIRAQSISHAHALTRTLTRIQTPTLTRAFMHSTHTLTRAYMGKYSEYMCGI